MRNICIMKKSFICALVALICLSCGSSKSDEKPDSRDKYCGWYDLYGHCDWARIPKATRWDPYPRRVDNSYNVSNRSLVVVKLPYDTVSLKFIIVSPFDTAKVNKIISKNEEIKKRNKESICGEDEDTIQVPTPDFDNWTIKQKIYGYKKGHKIFMNGYDEHPDYGGICTYKYDSVYMRNDTLYFKEREEYEGQWMEQWSTTRYYAVRKGGN